MNKLSFFVKFIQKKSPFYCILQSLQLLLNVAAPLLNMILIALEIDSLLAKDRRNILFYFFLFLGLNLLIRIGGVILIKQIDSQKRNLDKAFDRFISEKISSFDFTQYEKAVAKGQVNAIGDVKNKLGHFSDLYDSLFQLVTSLLLLFGGIAILGGMLIRTPSHLISNELLIFSTQYWPLFLLLVTGIILLSGAVERAEMKGDFQFFQHFAPIARQYNYYVNLFIDFDASKDIRVNELQLKFQKRIQDFFEMEKRENKCRKRKNLRFQTIKNMLYGFIQLLVVLYAGLLLLYQAISFGFFFLFFQATHVLVEANKKFFETLWYIQFSLNLYDAFYSLLQDAEPQLKQERKRIDRIEFRSLSYRYDHQKEDALKDINLVIDRKEKIALVGQNGSGKSTLVQLLLSLRRPQRGEILINGIPIHQLPMNQLASAVFQDFRLISATLSENISLKEDCDLMAVEQCAESAGLKDSDLMKQNPLLYKDFNTSGILPSGGEAQKIALARALYKNAPLFVMDEPTAALDPFAEYDLYHQFAQWKEDKISIFVSHRMASCVFCDRILVMEQGKIVQDGSHEELLRVDGLYKKMWDIQEKGYREESSLFQ